MHLGVRSKWFYWIGDFLYVFTVDLWLLLLMFSFFDLLFKWGIGRRCFGFYALLYWLKRPARTAENGAVAKFGELTSWIQLWKWTTPTFFFSSHNFGYLEHLLFSRFKFKPTEVVKFVIWLGSAERMLAHPVFPGKRNKKSNPFPFIFSFCMWERGRPR